MVVRSKGFRSKTRHKLSKPRRHRGLPPVTHFLADFPEGSKVAIVLDPSSQEGMPHPRFHGLMGTIMGRRGEAYLVSVVVGQKEKTLIARPQHLRAA